MAGGRPRYNPKGGGDFANGAVTASFSYAAGSSSGYWSDPPSTGEDLGEINGVETVEVDSSRSTYVTDSCVGCIQIASRSTPPPPLPEAQGPPHSVVQRPGPNGRYTTYDKDGSVKQYRGEEGPAHNDVGRPNVKVWDRNTAPNGNTYPGRSSVRPPTPEEIPIGPEEIPIPFIE